MLYGGRPLCCVVYRVSCVNIRGCGLMFGPFLGSFPFHSHSDQGAPELPSTCFLHYTFITIAYFEYVLLLWLFSVYYLCSASTERAV